MRAGAAGFELHAPPAGAPYLRVVAWQQFPGLRHGFTTRRGGVSRGTFATLNLAFHREDDPEAVRTNRQRALAALGGSPQAMVVGQQVHGSRVATVGEAEAGRGSLDPGEALPGCDALVTATPGLFLTVLAADCVPLLYYDPVRRVVGAAHAGWRGTARGIARAVVARMEEAFGTRPSDLHVAIGPAIGGCCYPVGEEVVRALAASLPEAPLDPAAGFFPPGAPGAGGVPAGGPAEGWRVDLKQLNEGQLVAAGVRPERIVRAPHCTFHEPDLFFSYRRGARCSGAMAGIIGLCP